jgi:hypothetical protein
MDLLHRAIGHGQKLGAHDDVLLRLGELQRQVEPRQVIGPFAMPQRDDVELPFPGLGQSLVMAVLQTPSTSRFALMSCA